MDQYLCSLAREYIQLVESMRGGRYEDHHAIDVARMTTHQELCRVLRISVAEDMYLMCKNLVHNARAEGDYEYDPD
jgi:hypothetical protein